jgi:hypothetical protein
VKASLKVYRYSVILQKEFLAANGFAMGQQETTVRSTSDSVGITVSTFVKDTGIVCIFSGFVVPKYLIVKELKDLLYTAARESNCQFLFSEVCASCTYLTKYLLTL